ncbi:hypothetical protein OG563_46985 [Nocardia vinacea]|uniref:Uncharacterized protein n=1 Tax=Nocardia vinacea TaxID=96468 RepID=A0ABZ1ZAT4_9NOCA|nr:hypothetical protein [Nocardia vinacea]
MELHGILLDPPGLSGLGSAMRIEYSPYRLIHSQECDSRRLAPIAGFRNRRQETEVSSIYFAGGLGMGELIVVKY